MKLYKYDGAGNDFLIAEGGPVSPESVRRLCDRHSGFGADGLMALGPGRDGSDFTMAFFNPDGSGGMMCGNGGRCIVAFAADCGLIGRTARFLAPDGPHTAEVLADDGRRKTVRLGMKDVPEIIRMPRGFFLDTGTRHLVCFVKDLDRFPVGAEGARLRHDPAFAPEGTNVNFVTAEPGLLRVRTFEKGVEGETLACGTGIVASAIAAWAADGGKALQTVPDGTGRVRIPVQACRDRLEVDFLPTEQGGMRDVYLTGPAQFVGTVTTEKI